MEKIVYYAFIVVILSWLYLGRSNEPEFVFNYTREHEMATLGKALIVGWTGETGKELVKAIATANVFQGVTLAGRRTKEDLDKTFFNQTIVDFENLKKEDFTGHSHVFCLLGTTKGKSGAEGFVKVDKDYVENVATISKEVGVEHFHLMTSAGASAKSPFLYPSTKGKVENFCKELEFPKLTIYQPGLLLCPREEKRSFEFVLQKAWAPFNWALGSYSGAAKTSMVADAMIKCASSGHVGTVSNAQLYTISDIK